jgi:hypothetical protein
MQLVRHAVLVAAVTTTVLGLANAAQATPRPAGAARAVNIRPGTVRAGQKVTVTTTGCGLSAARANSRAFTRSSVALTTTGYTTTGTATVRKHARPGPYRVIVTCQGQTAATGKLTVARRARHACRYRVMNVRRGHHLNVRSGPGVHRRVIGSLRWHDRRLGGTCAISSGWMKVTADNGRTGWSYGHYLHRVR